MQKYVFAFLTGAGVIVEAVLTIFAPAWRISIIACAVIALVALAIQQFLQYREERENRKQQEARDKRFEEIAKLLTEKNASLGQMKNASSSALTLRDKVLQLGHDLFAFLREAGPKPEVPIDHLRSTASNLERIWEVRGPYVERIHHGCLGRFKDRTVKLFHELEEHGIRDPEIEIWEIDPPQAVRAQTVRKIAEHLFLIAARMDVKDASKGT
jgi:hypothetical protein